MFGTQDLLLFVVSGLLLNLTPGPDTLYIVARSSTQGPRAGAVAALGIGAGTLIHITAAAFGLSAILAASAAAFTALRWIGAVYLVYVGVALFLARPASADRSVRPLPPASLRTVFLQGFLTNVLNPKVALFFIAFLPQFVAPTTGSKALAFLFLGAIFNLNGTLWNLFVAWLSARVAGGFNGSATMMQWFNRCVGGLFVYLGIRLALAKDG